MKVLIKYRVDYRLHLVQVSTGNVSFLVHLRAFQLVVRPEEEEQTGTKKITVSNYKTLYRERLSNEW